MTHLSYKTLFLTIVFLLIPIVFLLRLHQKASPATAAWWNDSWTYRQRINLAGIGSTQTDFQVSFSIGTSALIAAGKMKSDCSDIRLTDINGTILNHWLEGQSLGCNTDTTKIWIKIPSLPLGGATAYIYYGNPSANNTENGTGVFEFFDDFESTAINTVKWNNNLFGNVGAVQRTTTTQAYKGNRSVESYQTTDSGDTVLNGTLPSSSRIIHIKFYDDTNVTGTIYTGSGLGSPSIGVSTGTSTTHYIYRDNRGTFTSSIARSTGWHEFTFYISGAGYSGFIDNAPAVAHSWPTSNSSVSFGSYHTVNAGFYADCIFTRKYASSNPSTSLASEEVSSDPIAYWKFDEGVGSTTYDSSSKNNHGRIYEAVRKTPDQCIAGNCFYFDGVNDYINVPDSSSLDMANNITIEAWFKIPAVLPVRQTIVGKHYNEYELDIYTSGCVHTYTANGSGGYDEGINACIDEEFEENDWLPNRWYHLAWTLNGQHEIAYVNGIKIGEFDKAHSGTVAGTHSVQIGQRNGGGLSFNGQIDNVKIYPTTRTQSQILQDYNSDLAGQSTAKGANVNFGSKSLKFLSDGLVGYWKMDENVGTTTADASGNNNTATFGAGSSAPAWVGGKYGVGLSFDGVNDYVSLGSLSILSVTSKTISLWLKTTSTTRQGLLSQTGFTLDINQSGTNGLLRYWNGNSFYSTIAVNNDSWHLITITQTNNISNFYIDGILNTSGNSGAVTPSGEMYLATDLLIAGRNLSGQIDEIRLYNRALDATEVKDLYNYAPGPVAWWKMDEGSWINDCSTTTVQDSSGNGNSGKSCPASTGPTGGGIAGKYGNSGNFDGINDFVEIADNTNLDLKSQYTISTWFSVDPNTTGDRTIYHKPSDVYGNNMYIQVNSGSLTIITGSGCSFITSGFGTSGTWRYLTLVNNGTNTLLYNNGLQVNSQSSCYEISSSLPAEIGVDRDGISNYNEYFDGKIDDFRIYNYARTQQQIVQDMNAGDSPVSSGRGSVAYYKFDEGYGSVTANWGIGTSALNGTLGTGTSAPSRVSNGKFGQALSFDGTTDYVSVGGTINPAQSVSFWANPATVTNQKVIGLSSSLNIGFTGNTVSVTGFTSPLIFVNGIATSAVTANTWQHITVINSVGFSGNAINFGRSSTGFYSGLLDEIKIYNFALTADEVKTDYNQGSSAVIGQSNQTIGGTSTSLEYCLPGDTSACSPPVAEWKLDEGVGTTIYDTSGNNNHGVFGGNTLPAWTQGEIGNALSYNNNGYINAGDTASLRLTTAGTVSVWIKLDSYPNADTWSTVFNKGNFGSGFNDYSMYFTGYNSTFAVFVGGPSTYRGVSTSWVNVPLNVWSHITMTWDSTNVTMYINGILINQLGTYGIPDTTGSNFYLGSLADNYYYDGLIDQVRIYNYARTPAQVAWDYNRGKPVGWWKMDECQGTAIGDWSGNNNTGTLIIGGNGSQNSVGTCGAGTSAAWTNGAAGKWNSSLNFDGTDDYVLSSDVDTVDEITVSAWVKPVSTSASRGIISKRTGTEAAGDWALRFNSAGDNKLEWLVWDATDHSKSVYSTNTISTGTWTHVAISFQNSTNTTKIYINGVLDSTDTTNTYDLINTPETIKIGFDGQGGYFSGSIDDARLYNYALTSDQIKQLYNGGAVNFQ